MTELVEKEAKKKTLVAQSELISRETMPKDFFSEEETQILETLVKKGRHRARSEAREIQLSKFGTSENFISDSS